MVHKTFEWLANAVVLVVVLIALAAGVTFLAREWFLWRGAQSFTASLRELQRLSGGDCAEEFGVGGDITGTPFQQLRFTDDRRYFLEVVCPGFSDMPIAATPKVLSSFISKAPGNSGIVLNQEDPTPQYVTLGVFTQITDNLPSSLLPILGWISKTTVIGVENGTVVQKQPSEVVVRNLGPVAECSGYGYTCCDAVREVGVGMSIQNLNSCPSGCFERCQARPVVLSLRSNPIPDWETNQVIINSGITVEFTYIVQDNPANGPWEVTLDFGDGSGGVTSSELEGAFEHLYACAESECTYTASLSVVSAGGVTSVPTGSSQLEVLVRNVVQE